MIVRFEFILNKTLASRLRARHEIREFVRGCARGLCTVFAVALLHSTGCASERRPLQANPQSALDYRPPEQSRRMAFSVEGSYCGVCINPSPCPCEVLGDFTSACLGMGAYQITRGTFGNADISGARAFYAMHAGDWVKIYIDCEDDAKRGPAEGFFRMALASFGRVESVRDARILMNCSRDGALVSVDGGGTGGFKVGPLAGGDGASPVTHGNTVCPLNRVMLQGKAVSGVFRDAGHAFQVQSGRNGFFNDKMTVSGRL